MTPRASDASPSRPDGGAARFSIADGAPFLRMQRALRLVGPGSLAATRRAVFFAAVCWLPLLLLSAARGDLLSPEGGRAFLRDFTVPARFLLAVPMLLLIEPVADARLGRLVREFIAGGLVPGERTEEFREVVVEAHRGRDSAVIEALLAVLALVAGVAWAEGAVRASESSWIGTVAPDGAARLSPAGGWAALVSVPIAVFLLLRWLWRYALWVRMLRRLSRLDLRLVATHPDRCGGLGFIGQFPAAFTGFAFATSAVMAAALARLLVWGGSRVEELQWAVGAWSLCVLGLFALPLAVFAPPLRAAKERALLDFAALSLRHNRAFERRWIEGAAPAEDLLGSQDPSSLADLATGYQAAKAMRSIPLVAEGFVPVVLAIALPLACAIATQVPVRTMLGALRRFVL